MICKVIWKIYEIYFTSETRGTVNYLYETTQSNASLACGFNACHLLAPSISFALTIRKKFIFRNIGSQNSTKPYLKNKCKQSHIQAMILLSQGRSRMFEFSISSQLICLIQERFCGQIGKTKVSVIRSQTKVRLYLDIVLSVLLFDLKQLIFYCYTF